MANPDRRLHARRGMRTDLAPWDLQDHAGMPDVLCEIGNQGPLSRDAHQRFLAERCGSRSLPFRRRPEELAQSAETEP
jgi:hypothetical protein